MKPLVWWSILIVLLLGFIRAGGQAVSPATVPADLIEQIRAQISSAEGKVTVKSAYEPAARALALLCQSDPFFFLDEPPFAPAWTPPEVLKLNPTWVQITPDGAHVEFGGGFHHFGYDLTQDKSAGNERQNSWTLNFYSEDSPTKTLMTFMLNKSEHVERARFIEGALAEFERRAQASTPGEHDVTERLLFLLKFDEVDMARASIRQCAAANPNDWLDQLLAYVVDCKTDPAAASRLNAWAHQKGDFSAWLMAAYAYDATGDEDSTERCAQHALTKPVDDPEWSRSNARYRGAAMCAQLLKAGRYQTCAVLCDALLSYTDSGTYLAPQITSIRDLARHPSASARAPGFEEGTVFTPFKGIDLSRLTVAKSTASPSLPASSSPTTRASLSGNDRLLRDPPTQATIGPASAAIRK